VLAVPAARRLAREMNVDIEGVVGSGPNGRVRVDDVRQHAEQGSSSAAHVGTAQRQQEPYRSPAGYAELEERVPVRGLRRLISNQMVASHLQAVRTLHVDEADVSRLVELRQRLKPMAERHGVKLSYLPFILKAVVAALAENPALNASLDEASNEIVFKRYYNIGMAVATEAGLIVPVIKDVDQRSIVDLAAEVQRLADGARTGKLAPDDVKGGTFSITNIGSLGGLFSFPIINVPEAGILGVHSIKKRPVVLPDDSIVARSMIYLSLSFDHRLVDGAEGARFTGRVIELLETPEALFLDL
jgi:pyruvate dehydrogenase E2 component (dihydrolipoamide acetyltransferase)